MIRSGACQFSAVADQLFRSRPVTESFRPDVYLRYECGAGGVNGCDVMRGNRPKVFGDGILSVSICRSKGREVGEDYLWIQAHVPCLMRGGMHARVDVFFSQRCTPRERGSGLLHWLCPGTGGDLEGGVSPEEGRDGRRQGAAGAAAVFVVTQRNYAMVLDFDS